MNFKPDKTTASWTLIYLFIKNENVHLKAFKNV